MESCPGRYCGRMPVNTSDTSSWGDCGACPAGYRSHEGHCIICTESPSLFEWLYLGFMAMLPLVLDWLYVLHLHTEWKRNVAVQLGFAFLETLLATIFTLLSFDPKGSLNLDTCSVQQISDWYTIFFNPRIKFVETIHCSQEAVYPLYSIVFVYYLFSLALMLLLRPTLVAKILGSKAEKKKCNMAIYAALYFHPVLVIIHAVCAGLIYYAYPYLIVLATTAGLAVYAVHWGIKKPADLFGEHWLQNIFILTWHLLSLSYSIVALGNAYSQHFTWTSFAYLALVPLPMGFFLLTEKCTDPNHISRETEDITM